MRRFTQNFMIIMLTGLLMMALMINHMVVAVNALPVSMQLSADRTEQNSVKGVYDMTMPQGEQTGQDVWHYVNSLERHFPSSTVEETYPTTVTTTLPPKTTASKTSKTSRTSATVQTSATSKTSATSRQDGTQENEYITEANHQSPYYIVVYTGSQSVVIYGKDDSGSYTKTVKIMTCSTGAKDSSPTRKGVYKVRAKYRWRLLVGNVYGQYSTSISSSYLFHSIPYNKQDASTLKDAEYDKLGTSASHGCVRLCVRDSKWIYDNVPLGTQVHVVWASGPAGPGVPQRNKSEEYSGWDPTDQWAKGNPYFSDQKSATTTTVTTTAATHKSKTTTTTTTAATTVSETGKTSADATSQTSAA